MVVIAHFTGMPPFFGPFFGPRPALQFSSMAFAQTGEASTKVTWPWLPTAWEAIPNIWVPWACRNSAGDGLGPIELLPFSVLSQPQQRDIQKSRFQSIRDYIIIIKILKHTVLFLCTPANFFRILISPAMAIWPLSLYSYRGIPHQHRGRRIPIPQCQSRRRDPAHGRSHCRTWEVTGSKALSTAFSQRKHEKNWEWAPHPKEGWSNGNIAKVYSKIVGYSPTIVLQS